MLRRLTQAGHLDPRRANLALSDLLDLPMRRVSHRPLLERCWRLRDNLTMYDAAFVAVAEALELPLLTADARLAGAPGITCLVELVTRKQ